MSTELTLEQIQKLPKVELHRHVDGAVSPKLIWERCKEEGIEIAQKSSEELADFLRIRPGMDVEQILAQFTLVISTMQTKQGIRKIFLHQVLDLHEENIVYAELRFAPQYHTREGLSMKDVIEAALEGMRQGEMMVSDQTKTNLIVCIARECSPEESKRVVEAVFEFQNDGVVGIDLACNEAAYPPEIHFEAYEMTFDSKIYRTVHASEFGNQRMKNIETSIRILRANRIGHAIELSKSPPLLYMCKTLSIGVESCPISNVLCGNAPSIESLRLDILDKYGILYSINSDDPALFSVSLSETLYQTAQAYNWSLSDFYRVMVSAVYTAFLPEEKQAELFSLHFEVGSNS